LVHAAIKRHRKSPCGIVRSGQSFRDRRSDFFAAIPSFDDCGPTLRCKVRRQCTAKTGDCRSESLHLQNFFVQRHPRDQTLCALLGGQIGIQVGRLRDQSDGRH